MEAALIKGLRWLRRETTSSLCEVLDTISTFGG
jgi:hypothetical protein